MRRNLEGPIHSAILAYLRRQYPQAVVHHSPNQTDVKGQLIARAIAKQKMMGMLVGFPDLLMLHEGRFYGFEVKAEGGMPPRRRRPWARLSSPLAASGPWCDQLTT